ncbi:hypothetical protein BofuT4_uP108460.1 [Botrytis cinerea T4]|uniref:Uncharacterized protein n=1 Tax=Botryotinia fuckeliana (strain T4) TaxID=999810 RepID=G2Y760_BOTF4|nr:hypothetical protein BofuT4_uP108460.1 [Botrytis cinerea T4]
MLAATDHCLLKYLIFVFEKASILAPSPAPCLPVSLEKSMGKTRKKG